MIGVKANVKGARCRFILIVSWLVKALQFVRIPVNGDAHEVDGILYNVSSVIRCAQWMDSRDRCGMFLVFCEA